MGQDKKTQSSPPRLRHIPELDGIRGVAALAVFFHHVSSASLPPAFASDPNLMVRWIVNASYFGRAGVDLFFVLSGFLITSLLLLDRNAPAYYRDFYWKRALRILPVYLVCLVGILIATHQVRFVIMALLFIANFAAVAGVPSSGPFWSLAIEEQFYLIWPSVVRHSSPRQMVRLAAAAVLLGFVGRFVFAAFNHYDYYLTFLRCDGLAFGALLACFFHRCGADRRRMFRLDPYFAGGGAAGLAFFAMSYWVGLHAATPAWSQAFYQGGVVLASTSIVGVAIAHSGARWLALLRSRFLLFFGLISYAFYMLHGYVILAFDKLHGAPVPGDNAAYFVRMAATLFVSVALSVASRYVIELPALSLRKRVLARPSLSAEQAPLPLP